MNKHYIKQILTIVLLSLLSLSASAREVVIPEGTKIVDYDSGYRGDTTITSIVIPNSVTEIGWYAFSGCTSLTSVEIPNSVTQIGEYAFSGCTGLTSVEIPNSVTQIDSAAFSHCISLTSVEIPNSVMYLSGFSDCTGLTSIVIPNSVTEIDWGAFTGCTSLTSVEIPNSVTEIWGHAFSGCTGLTSVEIPNSVTEIGAGAFYGCTGLTSVEIPNSVTEIGWYAFSGCTALTSVEIPNSVTLIYYEAFYGCTNLSRVVCYAVERPAFYSSYYYHVFSDETLKGTLYVPAKSIDAYKSSKLWGQFSTILPIEETEVPTVTIDETIRVCEHDLPIVWREHEIYGDTVLSYNDTLWYMSLSMHAPVVIEMYDTISCGASYKDYGFTIKNPVSGIYTDTLSTAEGCDSVVVLHLEVNGELVIPEGTKTISYMDGYHGNKCITSVKIPNSVTEIGARAFEGCTGLTSVVIPNSVTEIGARAFEGCTGLTSVEIPKWVTEIGLYAFSGCTGLTSVEIPKWVTEIGTYAFEDCTSLSKVVCYAVEPPAYYSSYYYHVFSDETLKGTLYVPAKSIDDYKSSKLWGQFSTILPIEGSELPTVTIDEMIPVCEHDLPIMWRGHEIYQSDTTFLVSSALSDTLYYIHLDIHASSITKLTAEVKKGEGYELGDSVYYQPGVYDQIYVSAMGCDSIIRLSLSYVEEEDTIPDVPAVTVEETISACEHDLPIDWNGYWIDQDTILTIPSKSGADTLFRISLDIHYSVRVIDSMTLKIGESYQWNNWVITEEGAYTDSFATAMGCDSIVTLYVYYVEPADTIPTEADTLYYQGTMAEWCANPVASASLKAVVIEGQTYDKNTKSLVLPEGVETIHSQAFSLCPNIRTLVLPSTLTEISDGAFKDCVSLASVTCYAPEPPVALGSTFGNYNGYLYIPCDYQYDYDIHVCWGSFKHVECITAESTVVDDVVVEPDHVSADISWPKIDGVVGYTIDISLNGKVILTLNFNEDGQLVNIDFSKALQSVKPAPSQTYALTSLRSAVEGFRFSVTGLEEATTYQYTLKVLGDAGKVIESHSGEFTTLGESNGVEEKPAEMDDFSISVENGIVMVSVDVSIPVSFYNLQGQCLFNHMGSCAFRAPYTGGYVVRCGVKAIKVLVR